MQQCRYATQLLLTAGKQSCRNITEGDQGSERGDGEDDSGAQVMLWKEGGGEGRGGRGLYLVQILWRQGRTWKEVYTKQRYGLFSSFGSSPAPISLWMVPSIARMSTRPHAYRYLFSKSPCRFSSAVQARVHLLELTLAGVSRKK